LAPDPLPGRHLLQQRDGLGGQGRHAQFVAAGLGGPQRLVHPVRVGQPAQAMLPPIQPTAVDVFDTFLGARFDVAAVDPDGWRAQEPGLFGGLLVRDVDHPELHGAAELRTDPINQCDRGVAVGAASHGQHLDEGTSVGWWLTGWGGGGQLRPPGCGSRRRRGRRYRPTARGLGPGWRPPARPHRPPRATWPGSGRRVWSSDVLGYVEVVEQRRQDYPVNSSRLAVQALAHCSM
jgi:hypothetical protein